MFRKLIFFVISEKNCDSLFKFNFLPFKGQEGKIFTKIQKQNMPYGRVIQ